jgi:hypothetical protein
MKRYDDAAWKGYFVAVVHVSFPGLGQLRADGKGYRWLPANYTTKQGLCRHALRSRHSPPVRAEPVEAPAAPSTGSG